MTEISSVGPYRLFDRLGGGMSAVYRARNVVTHQIVALKIALPQPVFLESVRREIDALTRVSPHPGIVGLLEHGAVHGRPWYAMNYLEGTNLRQFVRSLWSGAACASSQITAAGGTQSRLTHDVARAAPADDCLKVERVSHIRQRPQAAAGALRSVLMIGRRICETLAFLHGENLINCDLKPENIILVDDSPVLIDFGLALTHPGTAGRELLEAARRGAGTLGYMAPEQLRGEFLDARTDLYAVGCILYEMITGDRPFGLGDAASGADGLLPVAPSDLVSGLPEEVEDLVLRLLSSDRNARVGYADEVAARLAEASNDVFRVPGLPPARPYLYRPRLRERDDIVDELCRQREAAFAGRGSLVLLGGESGAGKTRLAMEITRIVPGMYFRVVTSECSTLGSAGGSGRFAPPPLHAFKPVLRALADYCRTEGPDVVDRVLGNRLHVLAMYEPLLAQLAQRSVSVPSLPSEPARQRLFAYLAETLALFAREQSLLVVIDDTSWADELSVSALQSFSARYLAETPMMLLVTYRSEEMTPGLSVLAARPDVLKLNLSRLSDSSVRAIIGDMLAERSPPAEFVNFVSRHAEGNPFFAAEYLRTAVAERLVYRSGSSWMFPSQSSAPRKSGESLATPSSVRSLISRRLQALSPYAQFLTQLAAVLGREIDLARFRSASALTSETWTAALDELFQRHILERCLPSKVRFVHDKIREVAYDQISLERVSELHVLAAKSLEEQWQVLGRPAGSLTAIGHHYASGHVHDLAATFLAQAADYARSNFANDEAIHLYREALDHANQLMLAVEDGTTNWRAFAMQGNEALADLLMLSGQRESARVCLQEALALLDDGQAIDSARLQRKMGKSWEFDHDHQQALRAYSEAERRLALGGNTTQRTWRHEWVQVRLEQLWIQYWRDDIDRMNALIEELRPLLDEYASPAQQSRFFTSLLHMHMRKERYAISPATLDFARLSVAACQGNEAEGDELPMALFHHGLALLLSGSLAEAENELTSALRLFELAGNLAEQARTSTYLTLTVRRRGGMDRIEPLIESSLSLSVRARMRDYVGTGHANEAWLALKRGNFDIARSAAERALVVWSELASVYPYPFQWSALAPLVVIAVGNGEAETCRELARALLAPTQQRLPGEAVAALEKTLTAPVDHVLEEISAALCVLETHGYT